MEKSGVLEKRLKSLYLQGFSIKNGKKRGFGKAVEKPLFARVFDKKWKKAGLILKMEKSGVENGK